MAGHFVNYYLPYHENGAAVPSDQQAVRILKTAQSLLAGGAIGVAITYSANYEQTQTIDQTYATGGWYTGTSGANQAAVMAAMESLERTAAWSLLQGKVRIASITTMTYSNYGGKTHDQVIVDDLANIKALLNAGWTVLGWINNSSKPNYAVGGGVAGGQFTAAESAAVQAALRGFAAVYPSS